MIDFNKRIEELPNHRQAWAVLLLKELVKDMWDAGWSANSIATRLGKDHTTILYHLWGWGIDPSERIAEIGRSSKAFKMTMRAKKILEREKTLIAIDKATVELAKALEKKKLKVSQRRAKALDLYKQGKSYTHIGRMLGVSSGSAQSLLIYSDEYQKLKGNRPFGRPRPVNQFTKEGKFLKRFPSILNAAQTIGKDREGIVMNCKGRTASAYGYKWEYAEK